MIIKSTFTDLKIPEWISYPDFIFNGCSKYSCKPALIDGITDQKYLYKDIPILTKRVAFYLWREGLKKGDVVCVSAPNHIYYPIVYLAVLALGGIITDINPSYRKDEVLRQLRDSNSKYLITIPQLVGKVHDIRNDLCIKDIYTFGYLEGYVSIDQMLNRNIDLQTQSPAISINPMRDPAVLSYSSGTTGLPKGVVLTHYNLIANTLQTCHPGCCLFNKGTETFVVVQPFFHMAGKIVALSCGLFSGATLVVCQQFDYHQYLKLNEKYRATLILAVPPIGLRMSKDPNLWKYDLKSVREIGVGSAPIGENVIRHLGAKLNVTRFIQGYGMTEGTCVTSTQPVTSWKYGSVGVLVPNTIAKVVDIQTGRELDVGEDGEICMKGPQVMKKYHNRSDATAKTIDKEGWLHTGDIGHFDEDGHLYIVDRLKELIKVKGFQVAPAELEALLLSHPYIEDAAVIGVPDERIGELPKAYIVRTSGIPVTEQQIHTFVAEKVAPYKQLKGGIQFVDIIPKSPSGKILRRQLKQFSSGSIKSKL